MRRQLYCIVEGHGEKKAIPVLVKLALKHYYGSYEVDVVEGHFLSRGQIVQNTKEFAKALRFGQLSIKKAGSGMVGVFLDADDDTAEALVDKIDRHIQSQSLEFRATPIVFTKEYEAFFILDQSSLRKHSRVRAAPNFAANPEIVRNAKGFFEENILREGDKYDVVVDQKEFTRHVDCAAFEVRLKVGSVLRNLVHNLMGD